MGSGGSKPKKPVAKKLSSHDKAVLDLKVQRDRLKQYQKKIDAVIKREVELAKKAAAEGHKDKAILILKKKRYQEDLLKKTDNQLLTLEQMTSSIEFSLVESKVIEGIKQGNQVLKQINEEMSLEDVENLMKETADAVAYQNHVSDLLSGQYNTPEDEDYILEELEKLQELEAMPAREMLREALPSVATKNPMAEDLAENVHEDEEAEKEERIAIPS